MPNASTSARAWAWLAWIGTLAVGAYLRLSNLFASVVGDEVALTGPDSAYHARRMLQTWAHYPQVPRFDPLLNWPHGAVAPWPPGYDLSVATLALLAHDRFGAVLLIALAPVVYGLALIVLVAVAARVLWPQSPWWTGWIAASSVTLYPQAVSVARFGNPDHHIAEALLLLALGIWSVLGWRALAAPSLAWRERGAIEVAGALLVGAAIAAWTGAPIYVLLAAANLALAGLLWGRGELVRLALGAPALLAGAGLGALVYAPLVAAHGVKLSYAYPSWLQPLMVVGAAGLCVAGSVCGWVYVGGRRRRAIGAACVALVLASTLLALLAHGALGELLRGLREWFADSDSPVAILSENLPLFSRLSRDSSLFARAHVYYGVFGPLLPLLVPAGLAVYARRVGVRAALPVVLWTLAITGLMLLQNRFGRAGLVNLALCSAWVLTAVAERAGRLRSVVIATPALALLFDPAFHYYLASPPAGPLPEIQEAGVFLRTHTPAPRPGHRSGVLVPWDQAHFIVRYAERPVTATGFGIYVAPDAVDEVHRIWADREARLLRYAEQRDLGYVALDASTFTTRTWHGRGLWSSPDSGGSGWNLEYLQRVPLATTMFAGSGIAEAGIGHLEHLMPRFASSRPAAGLPGYLPGAWVFERVQGASVRGLAPPGALVRLKTPMRLRGQPFVHEAWTRAAADGTFELVTPVPTAYRGYNFETAPQAELVRSPGEALELVVPERSVRSGALIAVPDAPSRP